MLKLYNFLELKEPKTYLEKIYKGKIHKSLEGKLPKKYKEYLIKIYYPEIIELSERFSSYPSLWLKEIESNI